MLSEYYPYMFAVYEIIILYTLFEIMPIKRHYLLWLPIMTFSIVMLSEPIVRYLIHNGVFQRTDHMAYILYYNILVPWKKGARLKFAVCALLSVLAWIISRKQTSKRGNNTLLLYSLLAVFLIGGLASAVFRYNNLPYKLLFEKATQVSYLEEYNGVDYYYYLPYKVTLITGRDYYVGTVNRAVPIYAAPHKDAEIIETIQKDRTVYLTGLNDFHATDIKGWRYFEPTESGSFSELSGIKGFIFLDDALDAFSSRQSDWNYNWMARKTLLYEDYLAYENGAFITEDYAQVYAPIEECTSLVSFAITIIILIFYKKTQKEF